MLQAHCRGSDAVVRHGGEAFLLLMPETDAPGATAAAEKLRAAMARHRGSLPVTLSLGVAVQVQNFADAAQAFSTVGA